MGRASRVDECDRVEERNKNCGNASRIAAEISARSPRRFFSKICYERVVTQASDDEFFSRISASNVYRNQHNLKHHLRIGGQPHWEHDASQAVESVKSAGQ
jgi:hypothetical protein